MYDKTSTKQNKTKQKKKILTLAEYVATLFQQRIWKLFAADATNNLRLRKKQQKDRD